MDTDAAFAHLEELLDRLPAMQKQGARLAQAHAAERIARLANERETHASLLADAEERLRAAEDALARVSAAGATEAGARDRGAADEARRAVLQAASWRGFRIGPCQNADRALREALERGPFRTVSDARAACLSAADRAALEADVAAYQRDYAETLARCERAMES